jgi:hypothetical protein
MTLEQGLHLALDRDHVHLVDGETEVTLRPEARA